MKNIFPHYSVGHFINQPESRTNFEITHFERMEIPDVEPTHKHTFYEILWTEKGTSTQIIDYKEYKIMPNSLFFISPNQVHKMEDWESLKGGTIMFTEDFLRLNSVHQDLLFELSFLDNLYENPFIQFKEADFKDILQLINLISKEQDRAIRNQIITQSLLITLLSEVQRSVDQTQKKKASKKYLVIFKKFKMLLEENYLLNHTPSFYAEKLHITPHHLNVVTKYITAHTSSQIITQRKILEAKRLLSYADCSISEIANHLNYFDLSYFSRLFKKETTYTPSQFKTKMSDKYK